MPSDYIGAAALAATRASLLLLLRLWLRSLRAHVGYTPNPNLTLTLTLTPALALALALTLTLALARTIALTLTLTLTLTRPKLTRH